MAEARYLSHPESARLFVQERAGQPWTWIGCVGVKGIETDPRNIAFMRCITENGVQVYTIPRTPDPSAFDVNFHGNFAKFQSLHRSILKAAAKPNFLLTSADCRDKDQVTNPNYNANGVLMSGVDVASAYGFFSKGQAIFRDPNSAVEREDQLSFVQTENAWVRTFSYGLQAMATNGSSASSVGPIQSIAVVDSGRTADYICRACDVPGMQQMLIQNGSNFFFTYDGGVTWTEVLGITAGAGRAQAFSGYAFAVSPTAIRRYYGLDAGAGNVLSWTTATTDVAFAGLANVVAYDQKTLIVGGTNGAVWRSANYGASWKQVRTAQAATVNWNSFKAMGYNKVMKWLVGVGIDGSNAVYIQYSADRGATWTQIGVALAGKTWATSSYAQVYCAGTMVYVINDGDLYVVNCTTGTLSYTKLSITGASGNITGIGGLTDDASGNQVSITVWNGVTGLIFRSIDGFQTWTQETLPFAISAGQINVNPIIEATNRYGAYLLFGFDKYLYYGRDWESFFD